MKKVYINRDERRSPWGGGAHFVNAMHDYSKNYNVEIEKHSFSVSPETIIIAGLDNENDYISAEQAVLYKNVVKNKKDVKLIFRVNENDARKNTNNVDDRILKIAKDCDIVVFVSNWLKEYFHEKNIEAKQEVVIINGVEKNNFKKQEKFNNGKINIVTHHWSNNPLKGFDIYEQLDKFVGDNSEKYTFTYIGRDRFTFKNTKVINPLFGKQLGDELGKYDVYISASRFDPGPNHILESIACDIPTYVHKDGGGAVEFAGKEFVFETLDQFLKLINNTKNNNIRISAWDECVKQYCELV